MKFPNGCLLGHASRECTLLAAALLFVGSIPLSLRAQPLSHEICPRPSSGEVVAEPFDLRTQNGILKVDLTARSARQPDGSMRFCFTDAQGHESPNLRVHPGDLVILHLQNEQTDPHLTRGDHPPSHAMSPSSACTADDMMGPFSTNLHFHGLTIPPVCHEDDVLKTSIQPGDPPFEYRFPIPADEPPGLYWYHPHIHGFSKQQVLGGQSGALIVEGIERASHAVAGLPERVLIIRDQDLIHPDAPPSKSEPVVPHFLIDRDGDSANNGTGFGKPAKDLSLNYVPVPYPDYPPAVIQIKPNEKQLWRVLNASAITYLNLEVLYGADHKPQPLGLVAIDGVPINPAVAPGSSIDYQTHLGVPPGSRVEFILEGPPENAPALFVTRTVDTGPGGENDTNRALARIVASPSAPEPQSRLAPNPAPLPPATESWLGDVTPVRTRHLYFSEKLANPDDPASAVEFYLTVDGQTPRMFEMNAPPDIVVQQGTVEDWIIENRSSELHAFHIHQLHFLLLDYLGNPVTENFLRDTINVPYYNGRTLVYPSVRIRMDFRDPNIVGTFPYHCHLLEHEDKGMMGTVQVLPQQSTACASCSTNDKLRPK
jgi:FtsP/CotA-like multicopper oxidase with cupredoxin domain